MRLGYDRLRKGLSRYSKQVMVVSGLIAPADHYTAGEDRACQAGGPG